MSDETVAPATTDDSAPSPDEAASGADSAAPEPEATTTDAPASEAAPEADAGADSSDAPGDAADPEPEPEPEPVKTRRRRRATGVPGEPEHEIAHGDPDPQDGNVHETVPDEPVVDATPAEHSAALHAAGVEAGFVKVRIPWYTNGIGLPGERIARVDGGFALVTSEDAEYLVGLGCSVED